MCKIHVVRESGVQVLSEEEILPKNRISPRPKTQKPTVQASKAKKVTSSVVSAGLASQCSMPRSPRYNGVGEIDPNYWGNDRKRRGPETNHRDQVCFRRNLRQEVVVCHWTGHKPQDRREFKLPVGLF